MVLQDLTEKIPCEPKFGDESEPPRHRGEARDRMWDLAWQVLAPQGSQWGRNGTIRGRGEKEQGEQYFDASQ